MISISCADPGASSPWGISNTLLRKYYEFPDLHVSSSSNESFYLSLRNLGFLLLKWEFCEINLASSIDRDHSWNHSWNHSNSVVCDMLPRPVSALECVFLPASSQKNPQPSLLGWLS